MYIYIYIYIYIIQTRIGNCNMYYEGGNTTFSMKNEKQRDISSRSFLFLRFYIYV